MPDDIKEMIEIFEKLKESLKFHYDYHKHMTTINAGSILLIIAILEGIFRDPKGIIFIISSIVCFVLSLTCSLIGMTTITHVILSMVMTQHAMFTKNIKEYEKISNMAKVRLNRLDVIDNLHRISFFLGIVLLVSFAFINFL